MKRHGDHTPRTWGAHQEIGPDGSRLRFEYQHGVHTFVIYAKRGDVELEIRSNTGGTCRTYDSILDAFEAAAQMLALLDDVQTQNP